MSSVADDSDDRRDGAIYDQVYMTTEIQNAKRKFKQYVHIMNATFKFETKNPNILPIQNSNRDNGSSIHTPLPYSHTPSPCFLFSSQLFIAIGPFNFTA